MRRTLCLALSFGAVLVAWAGGIVGWLATMWAAWSLWGPFGVIGSIVFGPLSLVAVELYAAFARGWWLPLGIHLATLPLAGAMYVTASLLDDHKRSLDASG